MDKNVVNTQSDIAKHFGVAVNTVAGWIRNGCPGTTGAYVIEDVEAWRKQRDETARPGKTHSTVSASEKRELELEVLRAEARQKVASADRIERQERMALEAVCYKDDVQMFVARFLTEVKSLWEDLPEHVAAQAPPAAREAIREYAQLRVEEDLFALRDWIIRIKEITQLPEESAKQLRRERR
jgi:hypothetical protein